MLFRLVFVTILVAGFAVIVIGATMCLWYGINYGFRVEYAEMQLIRKDDGYLAFIEEVDKWERTAWWKAAKRAFWVSTFWLSLVVWVVPSFARHLVMHDGVLSDWAYTAFIAYDLLVVIPHYYLTSKRNALKMRFALECGKLAVTELEQSNGKN